MSCRVGADAGQIGLPNTDDSEDTTDSLSGIAAVKLSAGLPENSVYAGIQQKEQASL